LPAKKGADGRGHRNHMKIQPVGQSVQITMDEGALTDIVIGLVMGKAHRHPVQGRQGGSQNISADKMGVHHIVTVTGQKLEKPKKYEGNRGPGEVIGDQAMNRNAPGAQDFPIMAKPMQGHHLLLKTLLLAILNQLADRLLGPAAAEVVDDMQNPISLVCRGQSLSFVLSMNLTPSFGVGKKPYVERLASLPPEAKNLEQHPPSNRGLEMCSMKT